MELSDTGWQEKSACQHVEDADKFFPKAHGRSREDIAQAMDAEHICQTRCPVRAKCLEYALTFEIDEGIWGGLGERERRKLRRGAHRQEVRARLAAAVEPGPRADEGLK